MHSGDHSKPRSVWTLWCRCIVLTIDTMQLMLFIMVLAQLDSILTEEQYVTVGCIAWKNFPLLVKYKEVKCLGWEITNNCKEHIPKLWLRTRGVVRVFTFFRQKEDKPFLTLKNCLMRLQDCRWFPQPSTNYNWTVFPTLILLFKTNDNE